MSQSPQRYRIGTNDVKDALLRSGYLLESRIESTLLRNGFYTETNVLYPDPESGKPREIDLYAMTAEKAGPKEYDFIFGVLLIECVNNSQPIAFIVKEPLLPSLQHEEVKLAGIPVKVRAEGGALEPLIDYLGMDKYHHYCKGKIARQYCSFAKKKGTDEWMALHQEEHFDSLQKLPAAVETYIDRYYRSFVPASDEFLNIEFYYPVLVLGGSLLSVQPKKKSVDVGSTNHVQFRRSMLVNREEIDYQIDIVTEKYFPRYLKIVEKELAKTARLMRRRHKPLRKSIDAIAKSAQRFKSAERIRRVLEA